MKCERDTKNIFSQSPIRSYGLILDYVRCYYLHAYICNGDSNGENESRKRTL